MLKLLHVNIFKVIIFVRNYTTMTVLRPSLFDATPQNTPTLVEPLPLIVAATFLQAGFTA